LIKISLDKKKKKTGDAAGAIGGH
jgi:methionyl aminopeptidase